MTHRYPGLSSQFLSEAAGCCSIKVVPRPGILCSDFAFPDITSPSPLGLMNHISIYALKTHGLSYNTCHGIIFFKTFIYLFIWLHQVFIAAFGLSSCGIWA